MTKTRLEKIVYSFHHPRSLTTGRRARSRESLGDYIARFTREMEEGTRLNIHKLRYGPSTIKNYKGFVVQFDEYCKARRKQFDFADIDLNSTTTSSPGSPPRITPSIRSAATSRS